MTGKTPPLVRLAGLLSSQALAVGLLSALALLAGAGTLLPAESLRAWVAALPPAPGGVARWLALDDWYRSVPFRGLGALFLFQLLFCSLQRAARGTAGLLAGRALPGRLPAVTLEAADPVPLRERLLARGYAPMRGERDRFSRHGWWSLRGVAVHLAVATVVIGGSVAGLLGTLGTVWAPEGETVDSIRGWPDGHRIPLPFSLTVDHVIERYPLSLRLGLLWKESGRKETPVELPSGGSTPLPGTPLTAEILRIAPDFRSADLLLRDGEGNSAVVRAGPDHPLSPLPFDLFITQASGRREPEWFGVEGVLTEGDRSRVVRFGVNEPLRAGGHTVTVTTYRNGEATGEGWRAGLQIASSPGIGAVAAGALLLIAGLAAYLVPVREARILPGVAGSRLLLRGLAPRGRLAAEAREIAGRGSP